MEKLRVGQATPCDRIREQLPAFSRGELGAEWRGRVKGHVLSCQACALMLADIVTETRAVTTAPPMPRPPAAVLEATGIQHPGGGSVWTHLRALEAEEVPWAREEVHRVLQALRNALLLWAVTRATTRHVRTRGRILTRGGGTRGPSALGAGDTAWPPALAIEIEGASRPQPGRVVPFEVVHPATVTRDGHFVLTVRTPAPDLQNHTLLCTVEAEEGVQVTFTGALQRTAHGPGWEASLHTDGLPTGAQDVVIPVQHVRLALQSRPS